MYVPAEFQARDPWSIVDAFPFATLIALPSGETTHVPLVRAPGSQVLRGHVARASPLAAEILKGTALKAIFMGPHAYVSPYDYDVNGVDPGQQVPTWNYVAAHASGRARPLSDPQTVRALLAALALRFDALGWSDEGLPDAYREGLFRAIVAFELEVDVVEGKAKLGQNRKDEHRLAAAAALERRPTDMEREVGRRMRAIAE